MEYISNLIFWSIELVSKSITQNEPYDIDDFCTEGRIIVQFTGKGDNLSLLNAEILNSEWELLTEATQILTLQIEKLLYLRNREFKEQINQAKEIKKDQLEGFCLYSVL